MNWQPAFSAGQIHRSKSEGRGFFRRFLSIFGGGSDTARATKEKPTPSLLLPLAVIIHKRAERTCNRDPKLVAKYVEIQTILSSQSCSKSTQPKGV